MRLYTKRQARSFIAHAWSKECLELAKANECKKIVIPLIASGTFCFPKDKVLKIAVDEISTFLGENEMLVYTVVFDKSSYSISEKLFTDIIAYIDDNYVEKHFDFVGHSCRSLSAFTLCNKRNRV